MFISTFIKEYLTGIFYLLVIGNIIIKIIQLKRKRKRKRKRKKKSRKGGGILGDIWYILLCIITFGLSCNFWKKFFKVDNDDYDSDDSPLLDEWGKPISEETINRLQGIAADLKQKREHFFNQYLGPGDPKTDKYGFFGTKPHRRPPNK